MSEKNKATRQAVTLKGWQQDVISEIESHEERRDSEKFQAMADFSANRELSVKVAFPRGSGHTYLANLIASKYPSMLVYSKMDHYKLVTKTFALHPETETVSVYEVFFSMYKNDRQPAADLEDIRKRLASKKVVVIDNASAVSEDILNFIYDSARGIVVLLG